MVDQRAKDEADRSRPVALPDVVRALVVAHRALVTSYAATELRFTLDGRLVGDIAEATAAHAFDLELCRRRTPGVDARTRSGRTVQVKSSAIGKGPGLHARRGSRRPSDLSELRFRPVRGSCRL